ncbi:MAG: hypothetical protein HQ592_14075, partial [Planctomycetes bacterium]|nr:hypothetical protein [Planctomycetota bacterium]
MCDSNVKVSFGMPEFEDLLDRDGGDNAGIVMPAEAQGRVILILGPPGSGKSTLALQMAWGIRIRNGQVHEGGDSNPIPEPENCLYFALEQDVGDLQRIAWNLGWTEERNELGRICGVEVPVEEAHKFAATEDLAKWFSHICRPRGEDSPLRDKGLIIVPRVTPRSLSGDTNGDSLFSRRLADIHALLDGYLRCQAKHHDAKSIPWCYQAIGENWECRAGEGEAGGEQETNGNGRKSCLALGLVVIDSLNVFGNQELTREQLFALNDLFVRHGTIAIFVAEDYFTPSGAEISERFHPAEYVADAVIRLSAHREQGYLISTMELTKSRYQAQVLGQHPYKIVRRSILPKVESWDARKKPGKHSNFDTGVQIYRSVHRQLSRNILPEKWKSVVTFGSRRIEERLPRWMQSGLRADLGERHQTSSRESSGTRDLESDNVEKGALNDRRKNGEADDSRRQSPIIVVTGQY